MLKAVQPASITLTDFPGTPAKKQEELGIFTSYAEVFAKDGEDLGQASTIQHSTPTSDDAAVAHSNRLVSSARPEKRWPIQQRG